MIILNNTNIYNNITNFSKASKELLIKQLQEKGIILNQEEMEKLTNYYEKDKRDIKTRKKRKDMLFKKKNKKIKYH